MVILSLFCVESSESKGGFGLQRVLSSLMAWSVRLEGGVAMYALMMASLLLSTVFSNEDVSLSSLTILVGDMLCCVIYDVKYNTIQERFSRFAKIRGDRGKSCPV